MNVNSLKDFWKRVHPDETGCWLFNGSPTGGGHVQCQIKKQRKYAHRWMYEFVHGSVPDGLDVCHTCDVPNCVSPWHLFAGTHRENMGDAAVKGRKNKKLNINDARQIKELLSNRIPYKEIANKFDVSVGTICDIKSNRCRTYVS